MAVSCSSGSSLAVGQCVLSYHVGLVLTLALACLSCRPSSTTVMFDPESKPYEKLSEYQFFRGALSALQPNTGVLPYDLNTPLFSDYAEKARFVWMPPGATATVADDGVVSFPVGTVFIKTFFYTADQLQASKDRILETRLLVHRPIGWEAHTYVWGDDQKEALFNIAGDVRHITLHQQGQAPQSFAYSIPNKNQCKSCHERNKLLSPIGPTIPNLDRSYPYAWGAAAQLATWTQTGYLQGEQPVTDHQKLAVWSDSSHLLADRAMAYLEVNCGSCHHPAGSAHVSGLYLQQSEENRYHLGICKSPVSAGKGTGNRPYGITPGQPEASIMLFRMESTDPGAMMPELGRKLVHREGVALIRSWIAAMEEGCH